MRCHCLQHLPHEGPGYVAEWLAAHGHSLTFTRLFELNPVFPALGEFDELLVLGGSMSVHDEATLPWLRAEKAFIRTAITAGLPILGICLGAQLLAEALGGKVTDGAELEIGWFPVRLNPQARELLLVQAPAEVIVLHWHGETFSLPPDAVPLGGSDACATQGFIWKEQVVGLQFHPEVDDALLADMLRHEGHELEVDGPFVQKEEELLSGLATHRAGAQAILYEILDGLVYQLR